MYSKLEICQIAAASENDVIGLNGAMPWHIAEDFKYFKATTMGCPLIMGRKTWQSIGRPLPGRLMIVISRSPPGPNDLYPSVLFVESIEAAMEYCSRNISTLGRRVFVIGGGELYRQTISLCDVVYLTRVHKQIEGDAYFPKLLSSIWRLESQKEGDSVDPKLSFQVFVRIERDSNSTLK